MLQDVWIETTFGVVFGRTAGPDDGRLVLGLHGWSQRNGWHIWEPLMRPLGEAGFRVVSVDMPGWGQSKPVKPGPMRGDEAVTCMLQILDGLDAETAVLMGKSWGGGIAVKTAVTHPQRISHLILTAPALRNLDRLRRLTQPVLLAWAEDDLMIPFTYAAQFAEAIPDCQLETYPTGGHSAAPKNAADFAPKAIEFLQV
ncbi:MAG: alpha/beta fold hydrolase [Anaerolineae bacterium]